MIQGVGIGLVFLGGGTTGGTDMMAALIQKFLKHYSIAQIMQVIDAAIVIVGMYVFGMHKALYAIIAVYLVNKSFRRTHRRSEILQGSLYYHRKAG